MHFSNAVKLFSVLFAVVLLAASVSSLPSGYASEYDSSIRELVEMLMQRERDNSLEDSRAGYHTVSRKAGRSPQLRLRFGKRVDAQYPVPSGYISGLNDIAADN